MLYSRVVKYTCLFSAYYLLSAYIFLVADKCISSNDSLSERRSFAQVKGAYKTGMNEALKPMLATLSNLKSSTRKY